MRITEGCSIHGGDDRLEDRPYTSIGIGVGTQEEYKRALVELLAGVMHPPSFGEVTERYAWSIQVNKLLRDLKSAETKLAPSSIPLSFADVDVFVAEAWRLAVADDVPLFFQKWPRDVEKLVMESFKTGVPLGRMMIMAGGEGTAVGTAAPASLVTGRREEVTTTTTTSSATTPSRTPSLLSRTYSRSTSTQSSQALSPLSPTRRMSMEYFARLVNDADKSDDDQTRLFNVSQRHSLGASPTPLSPVEARARTFSPDNQPDSTSTPTTLALEPGPERSVSLISMSESPRLSMPARPWIPQSYRDGSMPADLAELFVDLDEVCRTADALIAEAEDIDAKDEGEMRLKEWTSRARKCEVNGRKALARVAATGLSNSDEVLYVSSTLKLLKSAHVELIEYAESMINFANASSAPQPEATTSLQPAIRNSEPTESMTCGMSTSTADPSSSSARLRLTPYVLLPSVPWRWIPTSSVPDLEPEPEQSKSSILTASITIRSTRQAPASATASSSSTRGAIKLQRLTDRGPNDEQHIPPCSECAARGFSCFGRPAVPGQCGRCKRVKKGHCSYAKTRVRGGSASAMRSVSAIATRNESTSGRRGGREEKQKQTERSGGERREEEASTRTPMEIEKGKKRIRPRPRFNILKRLESSRTSVQAEKGSDSGVENDGGDENQGAVEDGPPSKRRRSVSVPAIHNDEPDPEPEPEQELGVMREPLPDIPIRINSEPPGCASRARSKSRRRRFASIARSVSTWTSRHTSPSRTQSAIPESHFALGSIGPELEARELSIQQEDHPLDPILERDSEERPPEPDAERHLVVESTVPSSRAAPVPAPILAPSPPHQNRPTVPRNTTNTTILTPTSLPSPSSHPLRLPTQTRTQARPSSSSSSLNPSVSPLLVAALTAKLDALTASQTALTEEVRGAQAKLALQAGVIAEVRETLRVLNGVDVPETRSSTGMDLDVDVNVRREVEDD